MRCERSAPAPAHCALWPLRVDDGGPPCAVAARAIDAYRAFLHDLSALRTTVVHALLDDATQLVDHALHARLRSLTQERVTGLDLA